MVTQRVDDELELKSLREKDAEDLFALIRDNREYLRQWLVWVDDNTSVRHSRQFARSPMGKLSSGIWFKGRLVGVIGYQATVWSSKTAHIGYWLGASFQGQGIVTRSCRVMVDNAFGELGMNRAEIFCAEGNCRSRAIPERLGFTLEGTIRQGQWLYDHFADLVVYGMLASEWEAAGRDTAAGP